MRQDAALYIDQAPNGTHLGIVGFSDRATTLHHLVLVDNNRDILTAALPSTATGTTCIGCGLERGIQVRVSNIRGYYNLLKTFLFSHISTNLHQSIRKESFKTVNSYSDVPGS